LKSSYYLESALQILVLSSKEWAIQNRTAERMTGGRKIDMEVNFIFDPADAYSVVFWNITKETHSIVHMCESKFREVKINFTSWESNALKLCLSFIGANDVRQGCQRTREMYSWAYQRALPSTLPWYVYKKGDIRCLESPRTQCPNHKEKIIRGPDNVSTRKKKTVSIQMFFKPPTKTSAECASESFILYGRCPVSLNDSQGVHINLQTISFWNTTSSRPISKS